jgi:hypothetical protein
MGLCSVQELAVWEQSLEFSKAVHTQPGANTTYVIDGLLQHICLDAFCAALRLRYADVV